MARQTESDFPPGHPSRFDYNPESPEAKEWARLNVNPRGERDFPVDHPKAADTPENTNQLAWEPGVDPHNPHIEAFSGRTPEQAEAVRALSFAASSRSKESAAQPPIDAAKMNAALDAKRAELGRDVLTADEYSAVLAAVRSEPTQPGE